MDWFFVRLARGKVDHQPIVADLVVPVLLETTDAAGGFPWAWFLWKRVLQETERELESIAQSRHAINRLIAKHDLERPYI